MKNRHRNSTISIYEHGSGCSSPAFLPAVVAGDVVSEEHETPWPLRRQRAGPPLEALNPDHSDLLLLKYAPAIEILEGTLFKRPVMKPEMQPHSIASDATWFAMSPRFALCLTPTVAIVSDVMGVPRTLSVSLCLSQYPTCKAG